MAELRRNDDSLKKTHFAKLHERIQNKYFEMQRKLEKSKSVESFSSMPENFVYKTPRHASSCDISEIHENTNDMPYENHSVKYSVIIEEINKHNAAVQYVNVTEASTPEFEDSEINDNDSDTNRFFGEEFCKISLESLNEVAKESDECQTPTSPTPPAISIRNKIHSRISAVKGKRRQKEIENNATQRTKNEKKTTRDKVEKFILSNTTKQDILKLSKKSKLATVTIALIEATGLETDIFEERSRFLSCRLRLGTEKYKTKVIKTNTSEAKWQELFNFNLFDDHVVQISLWDKDSCVGRTDIDLSELEKEKTHKMKINLDCEVGKVQIFILLTISGFSLSVDDFVGIQNKLTTGKKSNWYDFKNKSIDVGYLNVIVYGAKGLSGQDCNCVLELDNERLQTHTEIKTHEPNWMKIFTFNIKDITSILDITVHDEKKSEDVGCLSIPLLNIKHGEKKWYALKDSSLRDRAKGSNPRILLEMRLTWNLVKASIRVVNPKEHKYLEPDEDKLDRHKFARNISRARVVLDWILDAFKVTKTCFEWESRKANVIALTVWLLFCWFFKVWMLPLLLLIPFIWYRPPEYFIVKWKDLAIKAPMQDENKKEKEEKKESLRQKLQSVQEMVQSVQNVIGVFASLGETIKNLFNFTVPFLSFLAIFLILVITFVMFMIPTKYIFMIWGIHKFTRKILQPNRVANNEVLDLLSRVPNDEILLNCEELPLEEVLDEDVIK